MAFATIGIETDGDARAEEMARTPESAELCPDRGLTEKFHASVTPSSSDADRQSRSRRIRAVFDRMAATSVTNLEFRDENHAPPIKTHGEAR